jgi:hypothetical protein
MAFLVDRRSVVFPQHVPRNSAKFNKIGHFLIAEHLPLNHFGHEAGEPLWV